METEKKSKIGLVNILSIIIIGIITIVGAGYVLLNLEEKKEKFSRKQEWKEQPYRHY